MVSNFLNGSQLNFPSVSSLLLECGGGPSDLPVMNRIQQNNGLHYKYNYITLPRLHYKTVTPSCFRPPLCLSRVCMLVLLLILMKQATITERPMLSQTMHNIWLIASKELQPSVQKPTREFCNSHMRELRSGSIPSAALLRPCNPR